MLVRTVELGQLYFNLIFGAISALERVEIFSTLNLLTLELLRFLADLSPESVAAPGGEERRGDSWDCETCNIIVDNMKN